MNPTGWAARYAKQRCFHDEWRTATQYALVAGLFVLTIAAAVPAFRCLTSALSSQNSFKSVTGATLQDLALASGNDAATALLARWQRSPEVLKRALDFVRKDNAFIFAYVPFLLFLSSLTCALAYCWKPKTAVADRSSHLAWTHWGGVVAGIFLLAAADIGENYFLEKILTVTKIADLGWARLFSHAKFTMLAVIALGTLLALLIGLRRELRFWFAAPGAAGAAPCPPMTIDRFQDLIVKEQSGIARDRGEGIIAPVTQVETSGEPRVVEAKMECVGLALSGGGIRSATFNAGLLQGLHRFGILRHVDYLATVSGGGYIGGFWSRWLLESEKQREQKGMFPDQYAESMKNFSGNSRVFEAAEIRHLREFAKFLVPRTGIFDTETWGAIVAMLGSTVPAILAALSVIGLSLVLWLGLTFYMACPDPWARLFVIVALTAAVLIGMELWWRTMPTGDHDPKYQRRVELRTYAALVLIGLIASFASNDSTIWTYSFEEKTWNREIVRANYQTWWSLVGISAPSKAAQGKPLWLPDLYQPSIGWLIVAALFIAFRYRGTFSPSSLERRTALATDDRVAMRLLGLATFWAVLATFWHIGLNLRHFGDLSLYLGGAAIGSTGLFALLSNWMSHKLSRMQKGGGLLDSIKPFLPQILAYLAVGLAWAALANKLIELNQHDWLSWYLTAVALTLPILWILLVDPQEFGLHAVYRDRICRAYLGAAAPSARSAAENRNTDLRKDDDLPLADLLSRPLHLICCAANNVGGDHLSSLSRGARSAVLSRHGVAMGNHWLAQPNATLGSAVTASAAAANSNMGSLSMTLGPAVSFLMAALNLRLGLWVDNPERVRTPRHDRLLPGWRFFKEMAAWTDTDASDIHLSDGGHFDNLGLYELVRRHCRYIIASDCGADPQVAFDDFGNAARRIREDFGVEIDIDITPLKPGPDGFARQHAVVGTIDYGWFDKGTLIYIKASLTGDEPVDTGQYKSTKPDFPHESTGDQFYDEAQWESYRRLGVHTANKVFSFVEHIPVEESDWIGKVFRRAKLDWDPLPTGLHEQSLRMTERLARLEDQLKSEGDVPMLAEIFPELDHLRQRVTWSAADKSRYAWKEEIANLGCLLRIMTLMEDTVVSLALTEHWSHPLNVGWVNLFARWATAPTFRRWWPLLKPMYGPALREFLEDRYVVLRDTKTTSSDVTEVVSESDRVYGFAIDWWRTRHGAPSDLDRRRLFQYKAQFFGGPSNHTAEIQLALVSIDMDGTAASWTSDHLFVPLSLWGSPLASDFLSQLAKHLASLGIKNCTVRVKGPSQLENNLAKWEERQSFVDYYRRAGFRIERVDDYNETVADGEKRSGKLAVLTKSLG
jgi:hypothetical protein